MSEVTARLRKPLERVIAHGHPWIWRDALGGLDGVKPGTTVRVLDRRDRFLARGLADAGAIGVRVLTREDRPLDDAFWDERVSAALDLRARLSWGDTNAMRLVHGEGDGVPGMVVDRYADHLVVKWDGQSLGPHKRALIHRVFDTMAAAGVTTVIERAGRGADRTANALRGTLPTEAIMVREHGMKLWVDLIAGHKTGLFLDHRHSRARTRDLGAKRVLNLFGYTGAFSVAAGLGGATEVHTVDVSAPALKVAERCWLENDLPAGAHHGHAERVDETLARFAGQGRKFDLVITDPPNFAPNAKTRPKALKAYAKLHRDAIGVTAPGGLWLAASCSSHVDRAAFETTIREAAHAQRVGLRVLARWGADADHPVPTGFPEGEYLHVILLVVDARR